MPRRIVSKLALIQALQQGVLPEDLPGAKLLGSGAFRSAYGVGRYVVKPAAKHLHNSVRDALDRLTLHVTGKPLSTCPITTPCSTRRLKITFSVKR